MYNYYDAMYEDIENYFQDNVDLDDYRDEEGNLDKDQIFDDLYDAMWISDSVTGNASGSYTFNSYKAEENLVGNRDLLLGALEEFGMADINLIEKGAEWCDVTIRCNLLSSVLQEYIDNLERQKEFCKLNGGRV